jgi:predicted transcriptional regulator
MNVKEIIERLDLSVRCGGNSLDQEINGGYAGDLLSDVIANSKQGDVWVTMQVHVNIVAVAVLKELSAIIVVQGREPAQETILKATEQNVPILVSRMPTFQVVGVLYGLGVGTT